MIRTNGIELKDKLGQIINKISASQVLLEIAENEIQLVFDQIGCKSGNEINLSEHSYVIPKSEHVPSDSIFLDNQVNDSLSIDRNENIYTKTIHRVEPVKLTPRMIELLLMKSKGLTDRIVAEKMGVKQNSVKQLKQVIYQRLGVCNITSALGEARKLNLLDLSSTNNRADAEVISVTKNKIANPKWPNKIRALYNSVSGYFLFATYVNCHGLACFTTENAISMFARFNQQAKSCVTTEMCVDDAEEIVRRQNGGKPGSLLLLDDLSKPMIRDVA